MTVDGPVRTPRSGYCRRIGALAAAAATTLLVVPWITSTGTAQEAQPVTLSLLDQTFSVGSGDTVSMQFAVRGDMPRDLLPTTTTTAPPTTTTTTTRPPRTATNSGPRGPGQETTTSTTTTTTTTPPTTAVPPPLLTGDVIVVAYPPITTRSQVTDSLAGDVSGEPIDGVLLPNLTEHLVVRHQEGSDRLQLNVEVPVASSDISGENDLELIEPGIYPVRVAIRQDGETIADYFTLVRRMPSLPAPGPRLAVVAGALSDDPMSELATMIRLGRGEAPLSVFIPPSTLQTAADIRPRLVQRLAQSLRGDEAVSLPTDEIDPSSAATAAALDDVFIDTFSSGEDALISLLPETPPRRTAWPLIDDLSQDGAALLSQLGVRLFVTDTSYAFGRIEPPEMPLPGQQVTVDADDRELGALVVDDDVARLVSGPEKGRSAYETALELIATLTLEEVAAGGRGIVLGTEGLGVPDRSVIDALGRLVDESPDVDFVTVSALPGFSTLDAETQLVLPATAGTDLSTRVALVDQTRFAVADTGSMLPSDDPRPDEWNATLDSLLTTNVDDTEAAATVAELSVESEAIRAAIVPPDPFRFTLTGRNSSVRLRLGNTSNTPLMVRIIPASPRMEFPDGVQVVEVLPGGDPTLVEIRVRARSNGTSSVAMTMTTPSGGQLGEPVILTARVNSLTGLSQVLTGGALLVLATWWFTHLRQRRRERRGLPSRRERRLALATTDQVSPDAAEALAAGPPEANEEPPEHRPRQ